MMMTFSVNLRSLKIFVKMLDEEKESQLVEDTIN